MLLATALLIIGLLLVVYSADRLVYAASILCRMLGILPDYWHDSSQHRYQFAGSDCFRRRFPAWANRSGDRHRSRIEYHQYPADPRPHRAVSTFYRAF